MPTKPETPPPHPHPRGEICNVCGSDSWAWDTQGWLREEETRAWCDECQDYDTALGCGPTLDLAIQDYQERTEEYE